MSSVFKRAFLGTLEYQGPMVLLGQRYNNYYIISLFVCICLFLHPPLKLIQLNVCICLCFRVCRVLEDPKAHLAHKDHR